MINDGGPCIFYNVDLVYVDVLVKPPRLGFVIMECFPGFGDMWFGKCMNKNGAVIWVPALTWAAKTYVLLDDSKRSKTCPLRERVLTI